MSWVRFPSPAPTVADYNILRVGTTRETIWGDDRWISGPIRRSERQRGWSWWYLLFVIQFVAVLWPPFYNRAEPAFIGMPFFYWYQLAWVIVGAILTAIVYFATRD